MRSDYFDRLSLRRIRKADLAAKRAFLNAQYLTDQIEARQKRARLERLERQLSNSRGDTLRQLADAPEFFLNAWTQHWTRVLNGLDVAGSTSTLGSLNALAGEVAECRLILEKADVGYWLSLGSDQRPPDAEPVGLPYALDIKPIPSPISAKSAIRPRHFPGLGSSRRRVALRYLTTLTQSFQNLISLREQYEELDHL